MLGIDFIHRMETGQMNRTRCLISKYLVLLSILCVLFSVIGTTRTFAFEEKEITNDADGQDTLMSSGNEFNSPHYFTYRVNEDLTSVTFVKNESVGSVTIPETVQYDGVSYRVTAVGDYACKDSASMVEIPSSVIKVGQHAFDGCKSGLKIHGTLEEVGDYAFKDCKMFTSISLGDGISKIGDGAFSGVDFCYESDGISIPESITSIPDFLFEGAEISDISIPDGVTSIGEAAFANCVNLSEVELPNGLLSIGYRAFQGCERLTEVVVPDSVEEVYNRAFADCIRLQTITFPISATLHDGPNYGDEIKYMLDGDPALKTIKLSNGSGSWNIIKGYAPWKETERESTFEIVFLEGIESIPDSAFSPYTKINKVVIPGSVKRVGRAAFFCIDDLASVTLQEGVEEIGYQAFAKSEFNRYRTFQDVSIPNTVKSIGFSAFSNCGMVNVAFENGSELTSISECTFSNCKKLKSINIPSGVKTIEKNAFTSCTNLSDINIPESLESIGDCAFYETGIGLVDLSGNVTNIGKSAFSACNNLTILGTPDSYVHNYAEKNNLPFVGIKASISRDKICVGESESLSFKFVCSSGLPYQLFGPTVKRIDGYTGKVNFDSREIEEKSEVKIIAIKEGQVLLNIGVVKSDLSQVVKFIDIPITINSSDTPKFEVEFLDEKGKGLTGVAPQSYLIGKAFENLPELPEKTDDDKKIIYDPVGWFTLPGGQGTQVTEDTVCEAGLFETGIICLYGKWVQHPCTIRFDPMNGNDIRTYSEVPSGSTVIFPNDPIKDDCTFIGWYKEPDGKGERYTGETTVYDDTTFYAYWSTIVINGIEDDYAFTGSKIMPKPQIYENGVLLREGKDYTLSYSNNTYVADKDSKNAPTITIRGKGNFKQTITDKFSIVPKSIGNGTIKDDDISVSVSDKLYNGKAQFSKPVVKFGKLTLKENKDYELVYWENVKDVGHVDVTVKGIGNYKDSFMTSYCIYEKSHSISSVYIDKIEKQTFTGGEITVDDLGVYADANKNEKLIKGTDYDIIYKNNINVGTATAIIYGLGDYGNTKTISFKIAAKPLDTSNTSVRIIGETEYTGANVKPEIEVKNGEIVISPDYYTVSYGNNKNVAAKDEVNAKNNKSVAPYVTVKFKRNYSGKVTEKFDITSKCLQRDDVDIAISDIKDNGKNEITDKSIKSTVKYANKTLYRNKDYLVDYTREPDKQLQTATIRFIGNYTGSVDKQFKIYTSAGNLSDEGRFTITCDGTEYTYTGSKITPNVTVTELIAEESDRKLVAGRDYTISYSNNTKAKDSTEKGAPRWTIKGKGAYTGSYSGTFTIKKENLSQAGYSVITTPALFTGKATKPRVTVKDLSGKTLKSSNYTVEYSNNIQVGENTAVVTVTGKGNYEGSISGTYRIYKTDISKATFSAVGNEVYTGNRITPSGDKVKVYSDRKKTKSLIEGEDYNLTYGENTDAGKATVTVTGIGEYGGSKTISFVIVPKWLYWLLL